MIKDMILKAIVRGINELHEKYGTQARKGFLESKIRTTQTKDGERQIIELSDSACFIPLTLDGYFILSSQFRASKNITSTSVYGGYVDEGETPQESAIREMYEECNISEDKIYRVEEIYSELYPSLGICNERNSMYLIRLNCLKENLDVKSNDVNETITPVFLKKEEVAKLSLDGMKAWIGQQFVKNLDF